MDPGYSDEPNNGAYGIATSESTEPTPMCWLLIKTIGMTFLLQPLQEVTFSIHAGQM